MTSYRIILKIKIDFFVIEINYIKYVCFQNSIFSIYSVNKKCTLYNLMTKLLQKNILLVGNSNISNYSNIWLGIIYFFNSCSKKAIGVGFICVNYEGLYKQ